MAWVSSCLPYRDTVTLLETSKEENVGQIKQLNAYFTRLYSSFQEFINDSPGLATDYPAADKRPHGTFRIFGDVFTRERSKTMVVKSPEDDPNVKGISKFENAHLCQIASFRSAWKEFAATILPFLSSFLKEYEEKMQDVIDKMKTAMANLNESRSRFDASYGRYRKAADELKSAWDRTLPATELAALKEAFISAQANAVGTHTHMNEVTAQTAMLMESGLTQYEETEAWRSEELKKFLICVGEWMENFAHQIEDGNLVFMQLQRLVPSPESLGPIMDCSRLVPPSADDRYQLVKVDPRVTAFLDKRDMFVQEQRRGLSLYKVLTPCEGHGDYLAVTKDEVIVCLEEKSANIVAMNINESKGLVPLHAIARL